MFQQRLAAGEQYDLYLDLHRDALAASSTIKRTVNIGGEEVARFMILVGQGTTGGYAEKPNWQANLQLAQRITDVLNGYCPQLARDVKSKTGRFNQHVSEGCLLIECGLNFNTLDEVLAAIPYLADAIAQTIQN
jgi:stage II sporulation protein P